MNPAETLPIIPRTPISSGTRGLQLTGLDEMFRFATAVSKSGFAPKGIETPESIFIALQMGAELGLTPMASLQSIAVINGRPGIFGDAALALVRGSGLCEKYEQSITGSGDARSATVTTKREGFELSTNFSVADAKKANLWGKAGPWTQYPDRMLIFRARGFNLRDQFGDVLKGFRTTEELEDIAPEKKAKAIEVKKPIFASKTVTPPDDLNMTPSPLAPTAETIAAVTPAPFRKLTPARGADDKPVAPPLVLVADGDVDQRTPIDQVEAKLQNSQISEDEFMRAIESFRLAKKGDFLADVPEKVLRDCLVEWVAIEAAVTNLRGTEAK